MKNAWGEELEAERLTVDQRRYLAGLYVTVPVSELLKRERLPIEITKEERARIQNSEGI